ncbi:MAG TPA: GntR family transcriptional regulator [Chthoniobacteraceae bacterium]|nr:GntR family transcriptional regulator [Chthoniobacteraceae bacterium]
MPRPQRHATFAPESDIPASTAATTADPTPLYSQVRRTLESRLASGEFPIGSQLPPEHDLCRQYTVSRNTLRKALELMEHDGLISRSRGKGSFVKKHPAPAFQAPHITRRVEIRCQVAPFLRDTWTTPTFQRALKRELPQVDLVINTLKRPYNPQDDRRLVGLDFYTMPSTFVHAAERRFLIGDWREVFGENGWNALVDDLPDDVARAIGEPLLPKLMPVTFCPLVLVYNRNVFDAARVPRPRFNWSEAEFLATCQQLVDCDRTHRVFPFLCEFFSTKRWPAFIYREGGRIWSEDGLRCTLDAEASLRGIRFLKEMSVGRGFIKAIIGAETTADCSFFVRDRVAIQLASFATVNLLKESGHENWGMVALPEGRRRSTVMAEFNIAVSPHLREHRLIAEFLHLTRRPEILAHQFGVSNMPVASKSGMAAIEATAPAQSVRILRDFMKAAPEMEPLEYPASRSAVLKLEELIKHVWIDFDNAEEHCLEICQEINEMPELQSRRAQPPPRRSLLE